MWSYNRLTSPKFWKTQRLLSFIVYHLEGLRVMIESDCWRFTSGKKSWKNDPGLLWGYRRPHPISTSASAGSRARLPSKTSFLVRRMAAEVSRRWLRLRKAGDGKRTEDIGHASGGRRKIWIVRVVWKLLTDWSATNSPFSFAWPHRLDLRRWITRILWTSEQRNVYKRKSRAKLEKG